MTLLPRRILCFAFFCALACTAMLTGCGVTFPVPTPPTPSATLINGGNDGVLIPLSVVPADQGHARLGLPVQLDGKAVYLAFDTGTQGVRVLTKVLPGTSYPVTGDDTSLAFANGAVVSGPSARVPVSVIGTKPVDMNVQTVNDVRCQRTQKRCLAMDGYTGEFGFSFSGIFGVGAEPASDACCTPPLRALPDHIGQRYLVHANFAKPFAIVSPSAALTRDFVRVPLGAAQNGATRSRWPSGCVQVGDKMRFCAPVVFATGSTDMIRVETDKAPNWTDDGDENTVLAQGNYDVALGIGSWTHRYEGAQVVVAKTAPGANRIVVGLTAMQNFDILLDFEKGELGLFARKSSESLTP
jgi:hypothetical protein